MLDEAAHLDYTLQEDAIAEAVALYLSRPDRAEFSDAELARELQDLMERAGLWGTPPGMSMIGVETVSQVYVVGFGHIYFRIEIYWGPPGQPLEHATIAEGNWVEEVRWVGEELGVISSSVGASGYTPDFSLLRYEGGEWRRVWPAAPEDSTPWRDFWITADGEASFAAEDLSLVRTRGSFWGEPAEMAFFECGACPHRFVEIIWERQGDLYVPQVTLPESAPFYDRLWEVALPSPYATLTEFLRRLRKGDEAGALQLAANATVIDQARALSLDHPASAFIAHTPSESNPLLFSDYESTDFSPQYEAHFQAPAGSGGHWLLIEIRKVV
ncbi:MAG: hypothetical protein HYZ68_00960 [Chloroflexi bacterium]|nr:hypothetical protein [Chloroflexota bacterium]